MAFSQIIARLGVQLGMDSAAFETGSRKASKQADQLGDRMEAMGRKVGTAIRGIAAAGVAIAGGVLVSKLKDLVTESLDYASSLGEVAAQLGVTTNALQEYRFIATQVGLSQEEMDNSLGKLTKSLGEAALGAKAPAAAFAKLGIDVRSFLQNGGDAGSALPLIADGLSKIGTESEKAAVLVDIFGKSGQKLLPLLNDGSIALEEFRKQAHEMGVVLSMEQIQNADETADKISALQEALKINIASAVANNAKAIGELATSLLNFAVAAINAMNTWLKFRTAMNDRTAQYYKIDQYLNRRNDLSISQKDSARAQARAIVDRRLGLKTEESGGLLNVKQVTFNKAVVPAANNSRTALNGVATSAQGANKSLGAVEGGSKKAASGLKSVRDEADKSKQSMDNLFERLFPEDKELADYRADLGLIDKALATNVISIERAIEARRRLALEGSAEPTFLDDYFKENIDIADTIPKMQVKFGKLGQVIAEWGSDAQDSAELAKTTFAEAAESISQSISNLGNAFRGGGILDILSGVLGIATQFGKVGLFGKSVQTNLLKSIPAYANGTRFHRGGLALVGEEGPELLNLPRGSQVYPNGTGPGSNTSVQIVPSPYFEVVVDGRVARAAPAIANAGGQVGMAGMTRKQTRRVG